jgi:HK97 family phage prohead protease
MTVADFSGYVTKANLKCSDGRTIMPEAFKHMDGMQVPLVWQHGHKEPGNVLGHTLLEVREDGVYGYGFFNDTASGKNAKALVEHKDISALSIFANQLVERSKQVFHGVIREVSLCLAGANPGAFIENVTIAHADGSFDELDDAALISFGLPLEHADKEFDAEEIEHANQTVADIYNTLSQEQKDVVNYLIGAALDSAATDNAAHSDGDNDGDNTDENTDDNDGANTDEGDLEHQEGTHMNVFESQGAGGGQQGGTLQHSVSREDVRGIIQSMIKTGGTLSHAVEQYALSHGIENLDLLFPDAKTITNTPEFDKRRTEWVAGVLGGTSKTPFAKVKSLVADITMDEARALGYIKGNLKKEEFFSLSARETGPTTIYKKQKLDRDDVIDITDFDIVAWMKAEMRLMLEEEIARAILIGDGRPVEDPNNAGQPNPDKIKDPAAATSGDGLRSILHEHELYATTITAPIANDSTAYQGLVEEIMLGMEFYKGTGTPTFYTTRKTLTKMLLSKDSMGRRLWRTAADLAAEMGVDSIVPVEVMEGEAANGLVGIIVNLSDYNVGTNRGGEVTFFDDFDIDYNQLKYLGETRLSGALVKIKSALIVRSVASGTTLVKPTAPTFVNSTGVVTIPTQTGTIYKNKDTGATLTAGAQSALAVGATLNVHAVPASSSYYFENSEVDDWSFTRS